MISITTKKLKSNALLTTMKVKILYFLKIFFNRHKLCNIHFPDFIYLETKSKNLIDFICFYFHHIIK